jgi:hypothetical protein
MQCGNGAGYSANRGQDLVRTPVALLIWGIPTVSAFLMEALWGAHVISFTAGGVIWILTALWVGVACAINFRRCGRVHCLINEILQPLLALSILLGIAGVSALKWNQYINAYWLILLASFVPEWFGMMYLTPRSA